MKLSSPTNLLGVLIVLFSFNTTAQTISTVAGNGIKGYSGNGDSAIHAKLSNAAGVALDPIGNLYIVESENNVVRKVDSNGIITVYAGNAIFGSGGDGGLATSAELKSPFNIRFDAAGNLFIADYQNCRIRKVDKNGIITTVAGNGTYGFNGDSGLAIKAQLGGPTGVAIDSAGNLYISDANNHRIRKVDTNGIISTITGNGTTGYSGDGGLATSAVINFPKGLVVDNAGNLFFADANSSVVRKIDASGFISTVAGTGKFGFSGDGGLAINAQLVQPTDVVIDFYGNLYIADQPSERVRKVTKDGIITTIAGSGDAYRVDDGYKGDGGLATSAGLYLPSGVAVNPLGTALYIADEGHNVIRKVIYNPTPTPLDLIDFSGKKTSNKTILTNWHTSTELNTSHFIIQHSTDGNSFTDIGTVKAIGSGANGYQFTDNNPTPSPLNGVLYYRLKSVDKDGSSSFSKVVSVQLAVNSNQLSVFPNPSKDKITVKGSHIVSIQIVDNLGRIIKTQALKDATNPTLSVGSLPAGAYHLRVQTTDGKVSGIGFVKE